MGKTPITPKTPKQLKTIRKNKLARKNLIASLTANSKKLGLTIEVSDTSVG